MEKGPTFQTPQLPAVRGAPKPVRRIGLANEIATNWAFTFYGDLDQQLATWSKTWAYNGKGYIICQKEICPTTGREHLQGMACLHPPKSFAWLRRNCAKACWTKMRESVMANVHYCTKQSTRIDGPYYYGIDEAFVLHTKALRQEEAAAKYAVLGSSLKNKSI